MEDFDKALGIIKDILKDHAHFERLYGQPNQDFYSIKFIADKGIDRRLCRIHYSNLRLEVFDAVSKGPGRGDRIQRASLSDFNDIYNFAGMIRRSADSYIFP